MWRPMLEAIGFSFGAQQDVHEFWKRILLHWEAKPTGLPALGDFNCFLGLFGHGERLHITQRRSCSCKPRVVSSGDNALGTLPGLAIEVRIGDAHHETSIAECIDRYLAEEVILSTSVEHQCSACQSFFRLKLQRRLLPMCPTSLTSISMDNIEVLIVHLPRGGLDGGLANQREVRIDPILLAAGGRRFDFRAAALHLGNLSAAGHYVAWVASSEGYSVFDDDSIWSYPQHDAPDILHKKTVLAVYTVCSHLASILCHESICASLCACSPGIKGLHAFSRCSSALLRSLRMTSFSSVLTEPAQDTHSEMSQESLEDEDAPEPDTNFEGPPDLEDGEYLPIAMDHTTEFNEHVDGLLQCFAGA